jgi:hypothetical protein
MITSQVADPSRDYALPAQHRQPKGGDGGICARRFVGILARPSRLPIVMVAMLSALLLLAPVGHIHGL